jgi:hypothetical protein
MPSLIGILAAGAVALAVGVGTFEQHDGGGRPDVDRICRKTVDEVSRLPRRGAIAKAAGMARLLRTTASDLRSAGVDELAWAFQTWAAADDDIRRSLESRSSGSARAGAAEWVARTDAATAAAALGAQRCVRLARG